MDALARSLSQPGAQGRSSKRCILVFTTSSVGAHGAALRGPGEQSTAFLFLSPATFATQAQAWLGTTAPSPEALASAQALYLHRALLHHALSLLGLKQCQYMACCMQGPLPLTSQPTPDHFQLCPCCTRKVAYVGGGQLKPGVPELTMARVWHAAGAALVAQVQAAVVPAPVAAPLLQALNGVWQRHQEVALFVLQKYDAVLPPLALPAQSEVTRTKAGEVERPAILSGRGAGGGGGARMGMHGGGGAQVGVHGGGGGGARMGMHGGGAQVGVHGGGGGGGGARMGVQGGGGGGGASAAYVHPSQSRAAQRRGYVVGTDPEYQAFMRGR